MHSTHIMFTSQIITCSTLALTTLGPTPQKLRCACTPMHRILCLWRCRRCRRPAPPLHLPCICTAPAPPAPLLHRSCTAPAPPAPPARLHHSCTTCTAPAPQQALYPAVSAPHTSAQKSLQSFKSIPTVGNNYGDYHGTKER